MNAKQLFHRMMRERREFPRASMDWNWRTRAAATYLLMHRNVPACEWEKHLERHR